MICWSAEGIDDECRQNRNRNLRIEFCDVQSWDKFFRNASNEAAPVIEHLSSGLQTTKQVAAATSTDERLIPSKLIDDHLSLQAITRAYQVRLYNRVIFESLSS